MPPNLFIFQINIKIKVKIVISQHVTHRQPLFRAVSPSSSAIKLMSENQTKQTCESCPTSLVIKEVKIKARYYFSPVQFHINFMIILSDGLNALPYIISETTEIFFKSFNQLTPLLLIYSKKIIRNVVKDLCSGILV